MKTLFNRADEIRKERRDAEEAERNLGGQMLLKEATDYFHEQFSDLIPMLKSQEGLKYEIKVLTNNQKHYAIACIHYHFKMPNRLTPVILDTKINTVELRYIPKGDTDGDFPYFMDSRTRECFTSGNIDDLVLHLTENLLK